MKKETKDQAPKDAGEMVGLALQDIVLSANIIDLATQRGAFKAAEAGQVGACFEKLVAFIKANTPKPEEKPEEKADADADASSSDKS
jgi:hypothetical protein